MSGDDRRSPFGDEEPSFRSFGPPGLVDAGTEGELDHDAHVAGDVRRERVAGRHGLWFGFRTQYPNAMVVTGEA